MKKYGKKKIIQQILSIMLVMCMLCPLFQVPVYAISVDNVTTTEKEFSVALEAMKSLGIFKGYPDGSMGENNKVTRAEMATIATRLLGLESGWEAKYTATKTYPDVAENHWAVKYLSKANEATLAVGDPDGNFRPDDDVTLVEAIKMILVAGGHGYDKDNKPLEWYEGYKKVAKELKMLDGVSCGDNEAVSRGAIILMVYKMLLSDVTMPETSLEEGTYTGIQKIQLSTDVKNAKIYYTLDGSEPNSKSDEYKSSIIINKTTTLKAITVKDGIFVSDILTVTYKISDEKETEASKNTGGSYIPFIPYIPSTPTSPVQNKYALTVVAGEGGTVTPTNGMYESGTDINLVATPNEGYVFSNWTSSNGGSFANASSVNTTFLMPAASTTITANFRAVTVTYALTIQASGGGTIASDSAGNYVAGSIIEIMAVPEAGYEFDGWTSSNGGVFANARNVSTTFTMPTASTTIIANFKVVDAQAATYVLDLYAGDGGTITTGVSRDYAEGTAIPIVATSKNGYDFNGWTATGGIFTDQSSASTIFTMPAEDVEVTANFTANGDAYIEIRNFKSDTYDILIQTEESVTFEATVFTNMSLTNTDVAIYESDGTFVAYMIDSGDTDEATGGWIFTSSTVLDKDEMQNVSYYAKAFSAESNTFDIFFYRELVQEDFMALFALRTAVDGIVSDYSDENGYIPLDKVADVIATVAEYAQQQKDEGTVSEFTVEENSVWIKLTSGLQYIFEPRLEGFDLSGNNIKITTCQPYDTWYGVNRRPTSGDQARGSQATDGSAQKITSHFSQYTFSKNLNDNQVDLNALKSFGANQVIWWHGHGGYTSQNHSFIGTGEELNETRFLWDPIYYIEHIGYSADYLSGRIICVSDDRIAVGSKFFDKYLPSMSGSFIYLGTCESGRDAVLANSFLSKGATTVIANSQTILTVYNQNMMISTCDGLLRYAASGKYNTVSQALAYAKNIHGNNDGSSNHATPIVFGSNNLRLSEAEVSQGQLSGLVAQAANRGIGIPNAAVNVYKGSTLVKTVYTNAMGHYSVTLQTGDYTLRINATGYLPFNCNTTVVVNENTYVETFLLVDDTGNPNQRGKAGGTITNAITGGMISDVSMNIRNGWNSKTGTVLATTSTNSSGYYEVELPLGNYTIEMSREGFITGYLNIIVQATPTLTQHGALAPLNITGDYRIVLTWGADPRDLDSHLIGNYPSGGTFHIAYYNKNAYEGGTLVANLDIDDTTSYGPETVTLLPGEGCNYRYFVHLFAGSGTIPTSGAQVRVYKGNSLLATYNVPAEANTGRFWHVFEIIDGVLRPINIITSSESSPIVANMFTLPADLVQENENPYPQKESTTEEPSNDNTSDTDTTQNP